ncbi:MAG: hypothetical protein CM1200mP2_04120 [Planctomycetaceae bacterium]|nr:MAG: hypothetical protein CM1200mP2_04120 [Planctomycetaceae bacterium]
MRVRAVSGGQPCTEPAPVEQFGGPEQDRCRQWPCSETGRRQGRPNQEKIKELYRWVYSREPDSVKPRSLGPLGQARKGHQGRLGRHYLGPDQYQGVPLQPLRKSPKSGVRISVQTPGRLAVVGRRVRDSDEWRETRFRQRPGFFPTCHTRSIPACWSRRCDLRETATPIGSVQLDNTQRVSQHTAAHLRKGRSWLPPVTRNGPVGFLRFSPRPHWLPSW